MKDIQAFIGLGYYRKFIDFSKIAKPLIKLTRKSKKFIWISEHRMLSRN